MVEFRNLLSFILPEKECINTPARGTSLMEKSSFATSLDRLQNFASFLLRIMATAVPLYFIMEYFIYKKNYGKVSFTEIPFSVVLEVDNFLKNMLTGDKTQSIPISLCSGKVRLQLTTTISKPYISYAHSNSVFGELKVRLHAVVTNQVYFLDTKIKINDSSYYNIQVRNKNALASKRILLRNVPWNQTLFTFAAQHTYDARHNFYSNFPDNHPGRKFSVTLSGIMVLGSTNETKDVTNNPRGTLQKSKLSDNLLALFEASNYSDIEISVGENNFSAHKCILTSRSTGFLRIIQDFEAKSNPVNIITINDFNADVVKEGLRFIYSGSVSPRISEMVCELLQFADKYEIEDLKSVCETEIKCLISVNNVCSLAELAHNCKAKFLQRYCNDFITSNLKDVMVTEGWKKLKTGNSPAAFSIFEAIALNKEK